MSEVDRTGYIRSLGDTLGITTWTRKKKEREEGRKGGREGGREIHVAIISYNTL
jgi:hypothetical protein